MALRTPSRFTDLGNRTLLSSSVVLPNRPGVPLQTLTKRYDDVPFAHRQHLHTGHCRFIHGHNWSMEFTFAARQLDRCGFIVDFGGLKDFKANVVEGLFDHALVLSAGDSLAIGMVQAFHDAAKEGNDQVVTCPDSTFADMFHVLVVPDCSCEGLSRFLLQEADDYIRRLTDERVRCIKVLLEEDRRNSCTAEAQVNYV